MSEVPLYIFETASFPDQEHCKARLKVPAQGYLAHKNQPHFDRCWKLSFGTGLDPVKRLGKREIRVKFIRELCNNRFNDC